jgi:hypothetical protein
MDIGFRHLCVCVCFFNISIEYPQWWEDGSAIYSYKCYWALPALSLLDPSPTELETIFFCLSHLTTLTGLWWWCSNPPPHGDCLQCTSNSLYSLGMDHTENTALSSSFGLCMLLSNASGSVACLHDSCQQWPFLLIQQFLLWANMLQYYLPSNLRSLDSRTSLCYWGQIKFYAFIVYIALLMFWIFWLVSEYF